jgi:hypothetical protein
VEPDDLYGLPLDEFTAARNALARERPEAKELRKPTVAAHAVNQLARRHQDELEAFIVSAGRLRKAQLGSGDVAGETKAERVALSRLLQLAGEYAPASQQDRIRQTLQAAAVDDDAAEQVRTGCLERELEPGGFGSFLTANPSTPPKARDLRAERIAKAEAERNEAQRVLQEAEAAETAAREQWENLRDAADRARRRVERADN